MSTDNADFRRGYEEGIRVTLQRLSPNPVTAEGDHGIKIDTVKLLKFAIQSLPNEFEICDWSGLPLRGEVAPNYSFGKALFVYGRRYRPMHLGEPF